MAYYGDLTLGSTLAFNFNTTAFADGSPITLAGSPVLSVYKNSTTETLGGITLTVDYDGRTGMHHVVVNTAVDTGFYAGGNDFDVVITAGTVGGTSVVGRVVGSFSINNRSALRPSVPGRTLEVDVTGAADAYAIRVGPKFSAFPQTARDIGANVLLSTGVGTGQLDFTAGIVKTNVVQSVGSTIYNSDGTLASATLDTVTFPTIDSAGNAIPDDRRYQFCSIGIVGGTGLGQIVVLTTATGQARRYNILPGTCPTLLDSSSQYILLDSKRVNLEYIKSGSSSVANLDRALRGIVRGICGPGSTTTVIQATDLIPSDTRTDQLKGRIVIFDKDTTTTALRGQATDITASTVGGALTVTALTDAPVSGDSFTIQ